MQYADCFLHVLPSPSMSLDHLASSFSIQETNEYHWLSVISHGYPKASSRKNMNITKCEQNFPLNQPIPTSGPLNQASRQPPASSGPAKTCSGNDCDQHGSKAMWNHLIMQDLSIIKSLFKIISFCKVFSFLKGSTHKHLWKDISNIHCYKMTHWSTWNHLAIDTGDLTLGSSLVIMLQSEIPKPPFYNMMIHIDSSSQTIMKTFLSPRSVSSTSAFAASSSAGPCAETCMDNQGWTNWHKRMKETKMRFIQNLSDS